MSELVWTRVGRDYETRKKLRSGKTALVRMSREEGSVRKHVEYVMSFAIVGKRKTVGRLDYFDDRMTGDGSLEGLLFAKRALVGFESEVVRDCVFVVSGSDSRRQRVYARYLTRIGYVSERRDGLMVMAKRVKAS